MRELTLVMTWLQLTFHSCALQYVMLHLLSYQLSMDDLKAFRQLDSKTPGHPEAGHTDGKLISRSFRWCQCLTDQPDRR
jgi:Transketolase, thiamine diphosphate binding domain